MAQKSIQGSTQFGNLIRHRRNELNLTIEEAALKAGVGTKTWSRYEAGESIRNDKVRGVCKALNWRSLPGTDESGMPDFDEYKNHEAWSPYIMNEFGELAAISFVIGSDILLDNIKDDMKALSAMPRESHIGQVEDSMLKFKLPSQFLMRYDYEFLYTLKDTVSRFRLQAPAGSHIVAHSVIEELALYLIVEESQFLMESLVLEVSDDEIDMNENWDEWIFDLFDDMDLITFLYSGIYIDNDNTYHFDHWLENQFYI